MSCNQQNDIWSLYNSFDSEENNTKNDNSE